jgi:hypothetical protein
MRDIDDVPIGARRRGMKRMQVLGVVAATVLCGSCSMHIDKPTSIAAGTFPRSVYSVDGDVQVQSHGRTEKVHSVDGDVTLGAFARASAIDTVSGRVELGRQAVCEDDLADVDGDVVLARGARVGGDMRTYDGGLQADDAEIDGAIRTVSGRIELRGITHVGKGIFLDRPKPSNGSDSEAARRLPVIVIGPGVVVDGPIVAQRGGTLRVSRQARIGPVRGLTTQWFEGTPPGLASNGQATP